MASSEIRDQVRAALKMEWEAFAAKHPALAKAIDQEMLTEACMHDLREETDFREAMQTLTVAPQFAPVVAETVTRLVKLWLGRM